MSIRIEKIAELIKKEISLIFLHKIQDPELGLVTITYVKVSSDIKYAKIYLSVFDKEKGLDSLEKINRIKGFIRRELAHRIRLKHVPELMFFMDDTMDYVEKMEGIFKELHKDDNKRFD